MSGTRPSEHWLCPDALFEHGQLRRGRAFAVSAGTITRVLDAGDIPKGASPQTIPGIVAPGYFDLQVNGGGGVLLNDAPTAEAMRAIAAAHHALGTVAILPTIITDDEEVLAQTVEAALEAHGAAGIAGLHIEGPHISVARRGTHNPAHVRAFEARTLSHIKRLRAAGVPTMITVAPEVVGAETIAEIAATGAVVSLGHSAGTASDAKQAFAAGARSATHLFNAMAPLQGREPGIAGAVINSDAYSGIICDGIHVDFEMVGLAIRARPVADRMYLVSDAMPTVGGPPEFSLYGQTIRLEGERLVNSEGSLAGAHTTMAKCAENAHRVVGVSAEEALRMGITVPADCMGLKMDHVEGRPIADLIHLAPDLQFQSGLIDCLATQ